MLKAAVVVFSCAALVSSALAASLALGSVDASSHAVLSGVSASPGATVFDGDSLTVPPGGSVGVDLNGGSYLAVAADSQVVLLKTGQGVAVEVYRGGVLLTLPSGSTIRGLVGDASFTPSGVGPFTGLVGFTREGHFVLYAEKGTWVATTEHDGPSLTLHAGERLEGVLRPPQASQEDETPEQANGKRKRRKMAAFWIGSIAAGTATGLGLAFGQSECTSPEQGPGCHLPSASAVIP